MPIVNNTSLRAALTEQVDDLSTIFSQKMTKIEDVQKDFQVRRIKQKISLKRETLGALVQPSNRISVDFTTSFLSYTERIASLEACKIQLNMTELDIQDTNNSWLSQLEPHDENDIHSVAGLTFIMGKVFAKAQSEITKGIWTGVRALTGAIGGTNLFNGLGVKLAASIVATELPAASVLNVVGAAAVSQANILARIKAFADRILTESTGQLYDQYEEGGTIFVPPLYISFIAEALNAALSNGSQIVNKDLAGVYYLNAFPNISIKPARWMVGVNNMMMTPMGNLFYLRQDTGDDIPPLVFQEFNLDLKIFGNFEANVDYADARYIVLDRAFV